MSATPILDRILDDLACDVELERRLCAHATDAVVAAHDQVAESFALLLERALPFCGGDDWKILTYIWSKTWLVGRGAVYVPLRPAPMACETGVDQASLWAVLDVLMERGILDLHLSDSPDGVMAYHLRIPGLEVA